MLVSIVAAVSENNILGKNNQLPWHLPADLKYFKQLTTGHHVLMGRKTWESIGKPLPNRISLVVSRSENFRPEGAIVVRTIEEGIETAREAGEKELFIIGGGEIFRLTFPLADRIYLTRINHFFDGDVFFPEIDTDVWEEIENQRFDADGKNLYTYSFLTLTRKI